MKATLLMIGATTMLFCSTALASEMVKLLPGTADEISAYVSGPEDAARRVLIVHDYFGLSLSTKSEAVWFGNNGIRATAIDLYGGKSATTGKEAEALMNGLDPKSAAKTVHTALAAIGAKEHKVTVIGFSMGWLIALNAQIANPDMVDGAALVYGGSYESIADKDLKGLKSPVLVVTGSKDSWAFPSLQALEKRMAEFGNPVESFVYPGVDHGYAQLMFNGGKNYDITAAMSTRNVVGDFVKRASRDSN